MWIIYLDNICGYDNMIGTPYDIIHIVIPITYHTVFARMNIHLPAILGVFEWF